LNSKNGTSVNGVRLGLNGESELKDEDLLTLAKTNFKVSFGGM
jgi:pSer/pThr/pTyr-binding forkhead associated (FHA) protein